MVFALVTAGYALIGDRHVVEILGTGSLSLAIGGLTTYLSSQARLHRERETTFREAELKLAVVAPMIDSINAETRDVVRGEVVKLVFEASERPARRRG